jgi:DNA topoisomerase I
MRSCQELPGQELLKYFNEERQPMAVRSEDVNAYLREISGADITAKDFRTWAGTVQAALFLHEAGAFTTQAEAKRQLKACIGLVSERLGNTPRRLSPLLHSSRRADSLCRWQIRIENWTSDQSCRFESR